MVWIRGDFKLNKLVSVILLCSIVSMFGTMLGASIGMVFKNPSKNVIGAIMGFSGGLMLSVVTFDLIPESLQKISLKETLGFYFLGIFIIMALEVFINKKTHGNNYKKLAIITAIGIMLHNLPEGIIMGCGFIAGESLGIKMSIIIALHDIPEGVAVTAPLMASKQRNLSIFLYAFITTLPTAIGALFGAFVGGVSENMLGRSLAFASGIMMYVVFGELIPECNKLSYKYASTLSILLGVSLGFIIGIIL
ncbi:ZIP family metal transporter [Clostridium sp. MSJ-4]|uniref:ZIP family metal transporter n=1 Tax=Clostridium simiarum TaxID=2841506 RepID=A0ABS6EW57_9CLOT|nr:ZIP family metal transporter [Clostridium simiarum]